MPVVPESDDLGKLFLSCADSRHLFPSSVLGLFLSYIACVENPVK